MTKPAKYLLIGLLIDFGIVVIAGLCFLGEIARNYNGRCGAFYFFGGEGHPCSLLEYMKQESAFLLIALVAEMWWLILPAFLLPPVIGYVIGRRRS